MRKYLASAAKTNGVLDAAAAAGDDDGYGEAREIFSRRKLIRGCINRAQQYAGENEWLHYRRAQTQKSKSERRLCLSYGFFA